MAIGIVSAKRSRIPSGKISGARLNDTQRKFKTYASRLRVGCPEKYDFPKLYHYRDWLYGSVATDFSKGSRKNNLQNPTGSCHPEGVLAMRRISRTPSGFFSRRGSLRMTRFLLKLFFSRTLIGQRHFGRKPHKSNPKRKRGNPRNSFPRLRFGLLCEAKVALPN